MVAEAFKPGDPAIVKKKVETTENALASLR
jgi:hypothetical protein